MTTRRTPARGMSIEEARRLAAPSAWASRNVRPAPSRRGAPSTTAAARPTGLAGLTARQIEEANLRFFAARGTIPPLAIREAAKHGSDDYVAGITALLRQQGTVSANRRRRREDESGGHAPAVITPNPTATTIPKGPAPGAPTPPAR